MMSSHHQSPSPRSKNAASSSLSANTFQVDDDEDDSDEEFLTHHGDDPPREGGTSSRHRHQDREALVRQKLLENFYGKSAVAAARKAQQLPSSSRHESDSDDDDDHLLGVGTAHSTVDWNSPSFDVAAHTRQHVWGSSVHTLLETEEHLALQVRTLDSTMQTLVYENYSRFIDATDAIRSVGVNVSAHEQGLDDLVRHLPAIEERARLMEDELGSVRDQVADKIRVKRLLSRLDGLLKLPQTLRRQISDGRYQAAARQYASAGAILSKHSDGFESLRAIEAECHNILRQLRIDLQRRLWHWSGRAVAADVVASAPSHDGDNVGDPTSPRAANAAALAVPAPRRLSDIFECAGALVLLLHGEQGDQGEVAATLDDTDDDLGESTDAEDLQAMSLAAAMRLLDRLLDAHLIQVQERRFAAPFGGDAAAGNGSNDFLGHGSGHLHLSASSLSQLKIPSLHSDSTTEGGRSLVPVEVLQGIGEAALSFQGQFGSATTAANPALLEFVSEAFNTFLLHVRATLLEEESLGEDAIGSGSIATPSQAPDGASEAVVGGVGLAPDVSPALHVLVSSVRDMSDRLVAAHLPGLTPEFAHRLVDQVVSLSESMVRRRVDQTFFKLRQAVVETCLIPLVERAVALQSEAIDPHSLLPTLVQIGGSTLSDCLQLVDDTIRTVFAVSADDPGTAPTPPPADSLILKEAAQASANRFASWLASALEMLAGGESSDPKYILEAPLGDATNPDDRPDVSSLFEGTDVHPHSFTSVVEEDLGEMAADSNDLLDRIDQAYKALHAAATGGPEDSDAAALDGALILALAEMCRLAQGSVSESLEQSIASHVGSKKKQRGLFPSDESSGVVLDNNTEITRSFQMAGSRLVVLFAANRGMRISRALCKDLASRLGQATLLAPPGPSAQAFDALEIVKQTCLECVALYGGPERAGPVPTMENNTANLSFLSTPVLSRKTGLQLDVERMFKEKVIIYPHPLERVEASRCAIVALALKVAFRALLEHIRMCTVSVPGYRQLHIDTEFLKLLIPHYIPKDYTLQGSNVYSSLSTLLADVLSSGAERCVDPEVIDSEDIEQESREAVRLFMQDVDGTEVAGKFIIQSGD